jgi:hypothetical protein
MQTWIMSFARRDKVQQSIIREIIAAGNARVNRNSGTGHLTPSQGLPST